MHILSTELSKIENEEQRTHFFKVTLSFNMTFPILVTLCLLPSGIVI